MLAPNRGLSSLLARLPGRRTPVDDTWNGGSFLHWVPDGCDGFRLAGEFLPAADTREPQPQRAGRRRGPRRTI